MLLLPTLVSSLFLAATSVSATASGSGFTIPFTKRAAGAIDQGDNVPESSSDRLQRLTNSIRSTHFKYGATPPPLGRFKREPKGNVQIANVQGDVQYYGSIQIGTPPIQYEVILDTGSSDLLLATAPCSGCVSTTPLYAPSRSSSAVASSKSFSITYGTGSAAGSLAQDVMSMGGFTIQQQVFGAVTQFDNILAGDLSGLLGLGWQTIATSRATPFVQALWLGGQLPAPVFGFGLARWNTDYAASMRITPGGQLDIGHTNSSLYTAPLNYIPLTNSGTYWLIPLDNIKVGGVSLTISAPSVTIDTGTTLIGVPAAAAAAIYARVPGAVRYQNQGLYAFPCTTAVDVTFTFGGIDYPMVSGDFNNGAATSSGEMCIGAVFELANSGGVDQWIIGDAFLKNVYTAFQFEPPAVGFSLITNAVALMIGDVPVSNGTTGSGRIPADTFSKPTTSGATSISSSGSGSGSGSIGGSSSTGSMGGTSSTGGSGSAGATTAAGIVSLATRARQRLSGKMGFVALTTCVVLFTGSGCMV